MELMELWNYGIMELWNYGINKLIMTSNKK